MEHWIYFLIIGLCLLGGLAADELGRRTRLPRVTFLMLIGVVVGQSGFQLLPDGIEALFEFLTTAALTMVAFLLGGALTYSNFAAHGRTIIWISVAIVLVTVLLVAPGLWLAGLDPSVALVLAAIAAATDPAATSDALKQAGQAGDFADSLRGIVAIDDAWGLLAFSMVMVAVQALNGATDLNALWEGAWEVFGALGLAAVIGFPAAYLTGRVRPGEPLAAEAIGLVFLTAGLALWLEVSFLIAGMAVGALIINFATHHRLAFHEIDRIQWPFMVLFFILAGASFEVGALWTLGAVGALYLGLRVVARVLGGWVGAKIGGAPRSQERWFGVALLPQAGVAIGMALIAVEVLPEHESLILSLTIGSTIVFELVGPVATIWAARRVAANTGTRESTAT